MLIYDKIVQICTRKKFIEVNKYKLNNSNTNEKIYFCKNKINNRLCILENYKK